MNFEGHEAKGLSKVRYNETLDGEDDQVFVPLIMCKA